MPKILLTLLIIFFANGCVNQSSKDRSSYKSQGDNNSLSQNTQYTNSNSSSSANSYNTKDSSNTKSEQNRDNNQTDNNKKSNNNPTNQDNNQTSSNNSSSNQDNNSNSNQESNSSSENSNSNNQEDNTTNDNSSSNSNQEESNQEDNQTTEQNNPPTAIATATPNSLNEGEEITFDASGSSDSDGEIVKYEWFENSTIISNQKLFTKSDFKVGKHIIELKVTDDSNLTSSTTVTIEVNSNIATTIYLKKSGQIEVYEDYDDGYYQIGFDFNYNRDEQNEIVVDSVTNLTWQDNRDVATVSKSWQDALKYCNNLKLANFDDWRLPTRKELLTLIDFSKSSNTFNEVFKNSSGEGYYWSSTQKAGSSSDAWYIYFGYGSTGVDTKSQLYKIRCVRDNQ